MFNWFCIKLFKIFILQSWQKVDINLASYAPEITPLILASHKNNYEIIKLLLDRGATLPQPHDVKCSCDDCVRKSSEDSLRHSLSRVSEFRALASSSLIALSSNDPLQTAFQVSHRMVFSNFLLSTMKDFLFNVSFRGNYVTWHLLKTNVNPNTWS